MGCCFQCEETLWWQRSHEIPQHGDTVKEGGCAAVTLLTSTNQFLANALPACKTEVGRLNSL